jgi:hypothetical protein
MALRSLQEHASEAKQRIGDVTLLNLLYYLRESPFFGQKIDLDRRSLDFRSRRFFVITL